ncbi:MAG TPA: hypothetical protein VIE42_07580 [Steroidobacteraceae bacterium]
MTCPNANLPQVNLAASLTAVPLLDAHISFGEDIDDAHRILLDPAVPVVDKESRLRQWLHRFQPCMFGRLGARDRQGIRYDMCWITRDDVLQGTVHVVTKIQQARREWKERASEGRVHGLLTVFNVIEFAYAMPGPELVELCLLLADLYLVEQAPLRADVMYAESIPLKHSDGSWETLKGGINIFHTSAHGTDNHDRRIPGGIVISMNAPGLLADSFVKSGLAPDLESAIARVRSFAWASIGNGGIGKPLGRAESCSWHNLDSSRPAGACPMRHRPRHVPENFSTSDYSALYHTDVLVPSKVMCNAGCDAPRDQREVWSTLDLSYLSAGTCNVEDENFGFVHGLAAPGGVMPHTTWTPLAAGNPGTPRQLL